MNLIKELETWYTKEVRTWLVDKWAKDFEAILSRAKAEQAKESDRCENQKDGVCTTPDNCPHHATRGTDSDGVCHILKKPTQDEGLREELTKFCSYRPDTKRWTDTQIAIHNVRLQIKDRILEIMSRYTTPKTQDEGLYNLCKELIDIIQEAKDWDKDGDPLECVDLDKARETLSRHPAPSPVEPRTDSVHCQLDTVKELAKKSGCMKAVDWIVSMQGKTFSEDIEPLAVLADRKDVQHFDVDFLDGEWVIQFGDYRRVSDSGLGACEGEQFRGKTYAKAESKARQYLNGLPDKKGDK